MENRTVVVKHLPEHVDVRAAREFLREMSPILTSDRPQIVFDLSSVSQLDAAGVNMLLQSMSEVMEHDGDLKLAAPSAQSAVVLEITRIDRLFEIYETTSDAVKSFTRFVPQAMRHQPFSSVPRSGSGGDVAA